MTTVEEQMTFNWSPVWCVASTIFFTVTKSGFSTVVPAKVASQGPVTTWKWINIMNSFLHSLITGVGALIK